MTYPQLQVDAGMANANGWGNPGQAQITGSAYQQVAAIAINRPTSGPLAAVGSTTVALQGGDEWDTVACHLTLDGAAIGADQLAAPTTTQA